MMDQIVNDADVSEAVPQVGSGEADLASRLVEAMASDGRSNPAFDIRWDAASGCLNVTLKDDRLPLFTRSAVEDFQSFLAALDAELSAGAQVLFVVYRSSVPGVFSYGGDLSAIAPHLGTASDEIRTYGEAAIDIINRNWMLNADHGVLTVALVAGMCLGGGLESALSCDLIFATEGALLGFPESKFGLFPGMGSYPLTEMKSSARFARKLLITGEPVSAAEAHAEGMVDFLVPVAGDASAPDAIEAFWSEWMADARKVHSSHVARLRAVKASRPHLWKELTENVGAMGEGIASADPSHGPRMMTISKSQKRKHKLEAV